MAHTNESEQWGVKLVLNVLDAEHQRKFNGKKRKASSNSPIVNFSKRVKELTSALFSRICCYKRNKDPTGTEFAQVLPLEEQELRRKDVSASKGKENQYCVEGHGTFPVKMEERIQEEQCVAMTSGHGEVSPGKGNHDLITEVMMECNLSDISTSTLEVTRIKRIRNKNQQTISETKVRRDNANYKSRRYDGRAVSMNLNAKEICFKMRRFQLQTLYPLTWRPCDSVKKFAKIDDSVDKA